MIKELTLFISHSSADAAVAKALIILVEKALKLPARQIRCTSVDGYRLPVGADTDEQLRREIFDSRAFIGVVTPTSRASAYVLFELGARWGAGKHLAPVLACGAQPSQLAGPIAGLNALRLIERKQVLQLVEDLAEYLQIALEPSASFQDEVDRVVLAASVVTEALSPPEDEPGFTPTSEEIEILAFLGKSSDSQPLREITKVGPFSAERCLYHLSRLLEASMIHVHYNPMEHPTYSLLQPGRVFLVESGRL